MEQPLANLNFLIFDGGDFQESKTSHRKIRYTQRSPYFDMEGKCPCQVQHSLQVVSCEYFCFYAKKSDVAVL